LISKKIFSSETAWPTEPKRFRGEDYIEIDQSETRIACGGHIC
jgi:hypothetical protein